MFGIDFRMPGMKFAVLSRCPTIGGKVASFDDKESKKISGVSYVGKISDAAVAVVADSVWGAMEGRRVLNVNWDEGPNKDLNTAAVMESLKQAAAKKGASLYYRGRRFESGGTARSRRNINCRSWRTLRWSRETARRNYSADELRVMGSDAGSAGLPRFGGAGRGT